MTKATSLRRTTTLPPLDPIETEILELQLATLALEIAISERAPEAPAFLAREHAQLVVAAGGNLLLRVESLEGEGPDEGSPRPPPT